MNVDPSSDAELAARARSGDKDALGALIARYEPMARRLARRMVADEEQARELVQDALLQAYLGLGALRDPARFRSWFYGIVLNVCRSHLRARRPADWSLEALAGGLRFESLPFVSAAPDPLEVAEALELHRLVLAAVEVLPPKIRVATLLFYYRELSLQEIAALLGVSVAAVKSRLHQARRQLKVRLAPAVPERMTARPAQERSHRVIKVTIADVIQREVDGESQYVVVLLDAAGRRILPIWIGAGEGIAIADGLRHLPMARPLTPIFTAGLLAAAGATVEAVEIATLRDSTFHALARLRTGDTVREVDGRASDALALAARTGSPIYVADPVLAEAGIPIPDDQDSLAPLGRGLDHITQEWAAKAPALAARVRRSGEAETEERHAFLAVVFGGE